MGLDQFAYRVKKGFIKEPVDFSTEPMMFTIVLGGKIK